MKRSVRLLGRLAHALLLLAGLLAGTALALQFTNLPWRAYKYLSEIPAGCPAPPSHILVMGGSGIPGPSGLMRTFYAARAAAEHPAAAVLVALPRGPAQSEAAQAYLAELRLRGVAGDRLRVLDGGRNTREQALRLAEYLADRTNVCPCILIVTDPEHIRRCAASIRKVCAAGLAAAPAFPCSLEDPLPGRAAEVDAAGAAPAALPDLGGFLCLRYNFWANLGYSRDVLREAAALLAYRLRGWL